MTQAEQVIEKLREQYEKDDFHFTLFCAQWIAGDQNKQLRQDIMEKLTGEQIPKSKCGLIAVEKQLAATFKQYQLF